MSQKKLVLILIFLFFNILLLVFFIPIIINELYKRQNGYLTLWSAADVLSYYGAILQAILNIVVLYVTILYTRKQIQYEHIEHIENEKLNQIEYELSNYLEQLYPLKLYEISLLYNLKTITNKTFEDFLLYQVNIKSVNNKIKCFFHLNQYDSIKDLLNDLLAFSNILVECANNLYNYYVCIKNTDNKSEKDLANSKIIDICIHLQDLTNSEYQNLLIKKKNIFCNIENNLEKNLSNIINFI